MMKRVLGLVLILLGTTVAPIQAAPTQSIAVVDVGVNPSVVSNLVKIGRAHV